MIFASNIRLISANKPQFCPSIPPDGKLYLRREKGRQKRNKPPNKANKDMSYQIITKMAYNAETRQIETWQHSNNVWPRTDYYYSFDATDENLYNVIKWHAQGVWQGRKWAKQFAAVFAEFPELIEWRTAWDKPGTYDDKRYLVHLADVSAERNKYAIVARFRELAKIV